MTTLNWEKLLAPKSHHKAQPRGRFWRLRVEMLEDRSLLSMFAPPIQLPVGADPAAVVVGDFNGDTIQDFVVANKGDNTLSAFWGDARGTFIASTVDAIPAAPESLSAGDINGDGSLFVAFVLA